MTETEFINNDEFLRIHNVDKKNINYDAAPRDNNFKINDTPPPGQAVPFNDTSCRHNKKDEFIITDKDEFIITDKDHDILLTGYESTQASGETKLSFNWEDPEIDPNAAIIQIQQIIEHLILKKL